MRRMNKPSQNKAESLILGCPTAYKGTPRGVVYSIKHKNIVFVCFQRFFMFKELLRNFKSKEGLCLSCFMRSALFLQPLAVCRLKNTACNLRLLNFHP